MFPALTSKINDFFRSFQFLGESKQVIKYKNVFFKNVTTYVPYVENQSNHVKVLVYHLFLSPLQIGFTRVVFLSVNLYTSIHGILPQPTSPPQAWIRQFTGLEENDEKTSQIKLRLPVYSVSGDSLVPSSGHSTQRKPVWEAMC